MEVVKISTKEVEVSSMEAVGLSVVEISSTKVEVSAMELSVVVGGVEETTEVDVFVTEGVELSGVIGGVGVSEDEVENETGSEVVNDADSEIEKETAS